MASSACSFSDSKGKIVRQFWFRTVFRAPGEKALGGQLVEKSDATVAISQCRAEWQLVQKRL